MADVFEQLPEGHPSIPQMEEARRRLFILIERTPYLDWLILTKRPENHWMAARWQCSAPPNVWLGTTAENQEQADIRIPRLLEVPWGNVKFISYEPALGPVVIHRGDFTHELNDGGARKPLPDGHPFPIFQGIDWVIAGAESGPGRRPMLEEWIRSMRDQCAASNIPFFYKQKIDGMGIKVSLPWLDDKRHSAVPEARTNGW
jgi:protein gp37